MFGCIAIVSVTHTLFAFVFVEPEARWPAGEIMMEMQLGSASGLIDDSADWNECAIAALVDWNANLGGTGVSFNAIRNSTQPAGSNDGFNNVFWSDDIFGTPFGEQTLAVTAHWYFEQAGVDTLAEADVIFNNAQAFNCYRGARRLGPTPESTSMSDMKRTALHEFGHVLGLDHPDQTPPPQTEDAIMTSTVTDIDSLQLDDIYGAKTLYGVAVVGIPFPPRDQVLDFFLDLENEYRDTLGRQQNNPGSVNAEGSAVWFPEWLRYVLNGCTVEEAAFRVGLQIIGQGVQPVCGVVASGTIEFPPRNESLDFLTDLDTLYRDILNETAPDSYIDLEGKAVWLQEYLRYRVNGCNNQEATDKVFQQIRGGGIAPVCTA